MNYGKSTGEWVMLKVKQDWVAEAAGHGTSWCTEWWTFQTSIEKSEKFNIYNLALGFFLFFFFSSGLGLIPVKIAFSFENEKYTCWCHLIKIALEKA